MVEPGSRHRFWGPGSRRVPRSRHVDVVHTALRTGSNWTHVAHLIHCLLAPSLGVWCVLVFALRLAFPRRVAQLQAQRGWQWWLGR